jgi:acyl-CoA synthetase (AMP-forming)/AMP-acid ligase II
MGHRNIAMNIVEPILFQCKLNPLMTAICVPGAQLDSIRYGMLESFIHNVARSARRCGIAPGNVVATYMTDTVLHTAVILGLMHAGATTLSLRGPRPIAGITPDVTLTDAPGVFSGAAGVITVDPSWLEGDGAAAPVAPCGDGDDTCRIILTSGSTGVPKGLAFSHRMLAARIAHYTYSKGPRFAHCARLYCDLGIATSPGFRYAMALLSRGGTIFFLGPDPADILQTIDLYKIQGMATSPYSLGEYLKFFEADSAFEVSFDHIICQGAMLSPHLSQRARARLCQNLYSSYGSTETTTVAFGPASVLERTPGAVGYVQPGVIVEAVDGSGNVLPPLRDGALRVRTEHMADGYVGDPETSRAFFRDGYFYTGDIGHLTADGLLVISGREKTALNIGGDTVSPELVEGIMGSFPNVEEAAVFALDDELGIARLFALIVAKSPIDHAALLQFCAQRLPPSCVPARLIEVASLPRGAQGKLERQRLPEIAAAMIKPI